MVKMIALALPRPSALFHRHLRVLHTKARRPHSTSSPRSSINLPAARSPGVHKLDVYPETLNLTINMAPTVQRPPIKIVALDTLYCPIPRLELPSPHTCELREYPSTRTDQIAERIRDADVVVCTGVRLSSDVLAPAVSPKLKMIAVVAAGTDHIDKAACKARGIHVANSPACNPVAVAEHTLGLYFAVRRSIALSNTLVRAGEWSKHGRHPTAILERFKGPDGRAPRTCAQEVVGIVGYGAVGKQIAAHAAALGMRVLLSARKGAPAAAAAAGVAARVPFETVLRTASVVVLAVPREPETMQLLSHAELALMPPHALLINVSRGGVVDEEALIAALKTKRIAGAATDVFVHEPAGPENSVLLGPGTADLNLVVTPHCAWFTEDTRVNFMICLQENLASWVQGQLINSVL
ncbi:MAG: hypothetical protein M1819_005468 [Sarea resinae]|nr:MAG: hypothetical protein M1819_005468 [Sarea resinae]